MKKVLKGQIYYVVEVINIKMLFYKEQTKVKFIEHSIRFYGQPKLSKPKELKGIKQFTSIDYISNKCKNQIFLLGDEVWVKHGDYFSPSMQTEEVGAPLDYLVNKYTTKTKGKKFIYGDAWGDIVLRNEAWVVLQGLVTDIKNDIFILDILQSILRQKEKLYKFDEYELCSSDMERFYESVIKETKKYIQKPN